jgi:hypothetical protein
MKNLIQEILTFDLIKNNENYYLEIPVQKLINPKFMIKDNNLYIFLYNFSQCFIIKNLPLNFLKSIPLNNCFIKQKLNLNSILIPISLI